MTDYGRAKCPVCPKIVALTHDGRVPEHGNSATDTCKGSFQRPNIDAPNPFAKANKALDELGAPQVAQGSREQFLTELRKAPGPNHYHGLDPQPIEVLRAWNLPYCRSVAIKYLARAGQKGSAADAKLDLQKAIQYIHWAIEDLPSPEYAAGEGTY
jgi:hypothetical protein